MTKCGQYHLIGILVVRTKSISPERYCIVFEVSAKTQLQSKNFQVIFTMLTFLN